LGNIGHKKTVNFILIASVAAVAGIAIFAIDSMTDAFAVGDCAGSVIFCETFTTGSWGAITSTGNIIGGYDEFYVEHPFNVSYRSTTAPPADAEDPANIAAAYVNNHWKIMRDNDGNLIQGASVLQEWVGVSPSEGATLMLDGYAVVGSSGGFLFKLVKQIPSQEAVTALGLVSIDHSIATGDGTLDPIPVENTMEGYCG